MFDAIDRTTVEGGPNRSTSVRTADWTTGGFEGLLAIVVTDIESFTSIVEQLGDAAAREVLVQHDYLLREAIGGHGGREVAHTGDGVIAVFRSIAAALEVAGTVQRALSGAGVPGTLENLRVRIGLHAGEPLQTTGRLIGTSLNIAVRICGAARPGQVLATDVVRHLASGKEFRFETRGSLKPKGLSFALQVHELML
jgi:adenylate cyclase